MSKINWSDFEGVYLKIGKGEQKELVLSNWRQESSTFGGREAEAVPILCFDVISVDGNEIVSESPMVFSTGSTTFAGQIKGIIERAERSKKEAIRVVIKKDNENRFTVVDLTNTK